MLLICKGIRVKGEIPLDKLADCKLKSIILIFLIGFFLILSVPCSLIAAASPTNILILNSYHQGLKWTDDQTAALIEKLQTSLDRQIFVEYMDWKRYPTMVNLKNLYEYYHYKYAGQDIDLLITTDDIALEFALKHRQELFSAAPLVFSGVVKEAADNLLQGKDRVTGVYEILDAEGTIRLALQINPEIQNIYVFHDQTESGEASGQIVVQAVGRINQEREEAIIAHCLSELSIAEITELAASLAKDSIILVGSYNMDITGQVLAPEVFVREVSEHSVVPVYSVYDFLLGSGILGGNLLSPRLQGEHAAALSLEILNGKEAGRLPIIEDPTIVTAFDYNKLVQFAIPETALPANSVLINKPFSFLEEYRSLIIKVAAVIFSLLGLVIILLINIRQRHEKERQLLHQKEELTAVYEELTAVHQELTASEEELRVQYEELAQNQKALMQSEERYRLALEAAKDTIWEWDLVNNQRVFSYKLQEILGYEGEELARFEDWLNRVHPEDLPLLEARLADHFSRKTENYHCEYRIQNKDGLYKWIRANGKAIFDDSGKPLRMVGSHRNITDLKEQAERIKHLAYHDYLTGLPNRVHASRK
jgi:PAS domain S-box-containing protein